LLGEESGRAVEFTYAPPRPGDQRVFVADIGKAAREFGWQPKHECEAGIRKLNRWINENLDLFR
jgi:CDP-paratose 2-epimerase